MELAVENSLNSLRSILNMSITHCFDFSDIFDDSQSLDDLIIMKEMSSRRWNPFIPPEPTKLKKASSLLQKASNLTPKISSST